MNQINKKNSLIHIVYISIGIIIGLIFFTINNSKNDIPKNLGESQAIFLSDGQVYFGKLENYNIRYYKLTNVYYLKYGNSIQQNSQSANDLQTQNLNLIKLGGEVHGPENVMYVVKDQILFIENLKPDSNVSQIINRTK